MEMFASVAVFVKTWSLPRRVIGSGADQWKGVIASMCAAKKIQLWVHDGRAV